LFDGRFRSSVDRRVGPIGSLLGRTGLSPDHLTAIGLVMAVPAAFAIGTRHVLLGVVLLIASAVPDLLDGALAKAKGTASSRGAFFDSVADRASDALVLGGVAWYLQSTRHGHAGLLPFGILAVSSLISYERAKAESLGFAAKGGLMERAERVILLCLGLAVPVILVPVLWVMLVLSAVTAIQRFAKVWRQASLAMAGNGGVPHDRLVDDSDDAPVAGAPATGGPEGRREAGSQVWLDPTGAVAERWRAWRQLAATRQQGDGVVARPTGLNRDRDVRPRATRWEERRAARLRADADEPGSRRSDRHPHSTRRP
jgi:CDP-diacylglycerol--glycerol-3-phosphate 3-phosphatidyltransferase